MTNNKKTFLEKAKNAYYRGDDARALNEPSDITEVVEDGVTYVVFENINGVLAVYRPGLFGRAELTEHIPAGFGNG